MRNKLIAIMVLVVAGLVFAQSEPTVGKPAPRQHRGFYNSSSFGLGYNWYKSSKKDEDYSRHDNDKWMDVDYFKFKGYSFPVFEFKFGTALANLVAFHTVFNMGFYSGTMESRFESVYYTCKGEDFCVKDDSKHEYEDYGSNAAFGFRNYLGFGSTVYPFRDKVPVMEGFFVGGSVGYSLFATFINNSEGDEAAFNFGLSYQFEIGKEWWVNDHLSLGFGLGYARTNLSSKTKSSYSTDNVLSLSFRMTRG